MLSINQEVCLSSNGVPGCGGLNRIMLIEEGYTGGTVPVIEVKGKEAKVRLPSGYELWITERDVIKEAD